MLLFESILMGVLQGLSEFLPISSSGHLAIVEDLLGARRHGMSFEVFVHTGTLIAILYVYRRRLSTLVQSLLHARQEDYAQERHLVFMLFWGSLPALAVAVLWKRQLEGIFTNLDAVAAGLTVTGLLLFVTRFSRSKMAPLGFLSALMIGGAQAGALIPGVSRSGATISIALLLGLGEERAAEFSFLLAVPAIIGATVWEISGLATGGGLCGEDLVYHLAGFLAASFSGLLAIKTVLGTLRRRRFRYFAYYCWAVSILVFTFL